MRTLSRISAVAVVGALALTTLTACGSNSESSGASDGKNVKVKIMVGASTR